MTQIESELNLLNISLCKLKGVINSLILIYFVVSAFHKTNIKVANRVKSIVGKQ